MRLHALWSWPAGARCRCRARVKGIYEILRLPYGNVPGTRRNSVDSTEFRLDFYGNFVGALREFYGNFMRTLRELPGNSIQELYGSPTGTLRQFYENFTGTLRETEHSTGTLQEAIGTVPETRRASYTGTL